MSWAVRVGLHVEGRGKAPVQPAPLPREQRAVQRLAHEVVTEPVAGVIEDEQSLSAVSRRAVSSSMLSRSTTSASSQCSMATPNTDAAPNAWRAAGESCSTPAMTTSRARWHDSAVAGGQELLREERVSPGKPLDCVEPVGGPRRPGCQPPSPRGRPVEPSELDTSHVGAAGQLSGECPERPVGTERV